MHVANRAASLRSLVTVVFAVFFLASTAHAADWYVKAKAANGGDGSKNSPFNSFQQVETASAPGDTIYILQSPSHDVLDGGLQLKDGQKLIGLGPNVLRANQNSARAKLTNTSDTRYDGDIVRLAKNNVVENIHFDNAWRSSILGINAVAANIRDNLITNDMAVHDLFDIEGPAPSTCAVQGGVPVCAGLWPNGFILFASQTNHFGAITLVTCGTGTRSALTNVDVRPEGYCKFLEPSAGTVPSTGQVVIRGNVIEDSNSDGIMLINDFGVSANFSVVDNVVRDLSQGLGDPGAQGVDHVVRSRAFTIITIENGVSNLELREFVGSNLSPVGDFAADGVVFLTSGLNPVSNNNLADISISNPFLSGDTGNGDSIEIQHRGSTNGILNVDIRRADLRDPASTNIKIIESSNPDNGTYNVTVRDSVLSNVNSRGNEDAQIRFSGTARTQIKAINVSLDNVEISGLGRGIGVAGASFNNKVLQLHIKVQNSSLADLSKDAVFYVNPANQQIGTVGGAIIDLGGGPLGSVGRNRLVNNGVVPANLPVIPGENVDPTEPEDIDVHNQNTTGPAINIYGANNFWGGGAPVAGTDIIVSGNVTVSPATFTNFLTTDPQ
jgi:hypothetical protein